MARKSATQDPNSADLAEDTPVLSNQGLRMRKLSADEELNLLLTAPAAGIPDHALDLAPAGSKVVVVPAARKGGRMAVLATPDASPKPLPDGDPAHRLPILTKIHKPLDGRFFLVLPAEYATDEQMIGGRAADLIAQAVLIVTGAGKE